MTTVLGKQSAADPVPGQAQGRCLSATSRRGGPVAKLLRDRAALTVFDQALSSASNFAVAVVVARLAGKGGLGVFSVAYAVWLFLASQHRSLVTDPMAIEGDARTLEAKRRLSVGLSAELLLGLTASVTCALIGLGLLATGPDGFGPALLSVAPCLVALVVQDYWRWAGFMSGRPGRSLLNDAVFAVVQAGLFVAIFLAVVHPSIGLVVGAWGLAALVAALVGAWQFRLGPARCGAWHLLRSRWHLSRWLVGHDLTQWGTNQGFLVLAGALLGPAALGGLKAAQALVTGPSLVLLQAGGSVGLPEASHALAEQGGPGLRRVTRLVTIAAASSVGLIAVVVMVAGRPLLTAIYGPSFGSLHTTAALIAVSATVSAVGLGPILALKAQRVTRPLVSAQLVALGALLAGVLALTGPFATNGTATASVLSSTVLTLLLVRALRRAEGRRLSPPTRTTNYVRRLRARAPRAARS